MQKIYPSLHGYDWGSKSFIHQMLGVKEPELISEAWYGAHPKAPSKLDEGDMLEISQRDKKYWLGPSCNEFPFLLKILAAEKALSIQVHPSAQEAEAGFAKENMLKIPLDSPLRSYRDSKHKPELLMALTPFYALCGFREDYEIIEIFEELKLNELFRMPFMDFKYGPSETTLQLLYAEVIKSGENILVQDWLEEMPVNEKYASELYWCKELARLYPNDGACLSVFFLNLISLKPYEAIYLDAKIIHAYLKGAGIEIMSNSDNVLRAGLTSKHIDSEELFKVMSTTTYKPVITKGELKADTLMNFPAPVSEFSLHLGQVETELKLSQLCGVKIVLVLDGALSLHHRDESLVLNKGEAAVIPDSQKELMVKGKANFVFASPNLY